MSAPGRCRDPRAVPVPAFRLRLAAANVIAALAAALVAAGAASAAGDLRPVPPPVGLAVTTHSQDSLWLEWRAPRPGIAQYRVTLDGALAGLTRSLAYHFPSLRCGTSYTMAVAAVGRTGAVSAPASLAAATDPCPAPVDAVPPTKPLALAAGAVTDDGATLTWTAATDDVGVTGYDVLVDGVTAGQAAGTSYALTGLDCGTAHAVAVDAFDAAGNTSAQDHASFSTLACPASPPARFWSAGSFLNTPIGSFDPDPSSADWVSRLAASEGYGLWVDYDRFWSAPVYHADADTPTVTVAIANTGRHIAIPYRPDFRPDLSTDSQLAVIDDATGCEYEFQAFDPVALTAHAEATFHIATGTGLHADDAGVTGSNISILGGLITAQDVAGGSIDHALRYATPIDAPGFVPPAGRSDGGTGGGIPAGELLRLDPALDLAPFGLTPFQLMVARALQTYGAYNADASGSFKLYAENTVDGATYATPIAPLPWAVVSHLQFGSTTFAPGALALDTNSDPSCSRQQG